MTILFAGLALGSIYALVALTYNVVLTQTGIFNFAQAQFVVLGVYLAYAGRDLPFILVVVAAAVVGAVLGAIEEIVAIRPLGVDAAQGSLVTTVSFFVAIEGVIVLIWGTDPFSVDFFGGNEAFSLLGGRLQPVDLFLFVLAIVMTVVFELMRRKSHWVVAARAATIDRDAAALRGINVRMLRTAGFAAAGALGCAVGTAIGPRLGVSVSLGFTLLIFGFAAYAIGGFGSYVGCLVGGLLTGCIEAFSDRYFGNEFSALVLFAVLLTVLVLRPNGLLGSKQLRTV